MTSGMRLQKAGVPEGSVDRLMIRNSSPPQRTGMSDLAHNSGEALRNLLQQSVPGRVAMAVVDFVEEVHVYHDEDQVAMLKVLNVVLRTR
jgi:hypothetical protein